MRRDNQTPANGVVQVPESDRGSDVASDSREAKGEHAKGQDAPRAHREYFELEMPTHRFRNGGKEKWCMTPGSKSWRVGPPAPSNKPHYYYITRAYVSFKMRGGRWIQVSIRKYFVVVVFFL